MNLGNFSTTSSNDSVHCELPKVSIGFFGILITLFAPNQCSILWEVHNEPDQWPRAA